MSYITIPASDNSGEFQAYIAHPKTSDKTSVILVIQEIFGVNKNLRDICDLYASKGYIAICPDLFWRQEPGVDITDQSEAEWQKAFELFNGFDIDKGIEDIIATLNFMRDYETSNGKVGCVGYCLGGKLSYLTAARSDIDCSVSYYGVGLNELVDEKSGITSPLLMHVAELDEFVPKEAQTVMKEHFEPHAQITYCYYKGVDHAFTRINGAHYDETQAKIANQRSYDFFKRYLK